MTMIFFPTPLWINGGKMLVTDSIAMTLWSIASANAALIFGRLSSSLAADADSATVVSAFQPAFSSRVLRDPLVAFEMADASLRSCSGFVMSAFRT